MARLLEHCDSASICLSKVQGITLNWILTVLSITCQGLGCPVGSVIVGSRALIDRAVRVRKVRKSHMDT